MRYNNYIIIFTGIECDTRKYCMSQKDLCDIFLASTIFSCNIRNKLVNIIIITIYIRLFCLVNIIRTSRNCNVSSLVAILNNEINTQPSYGYFGETILNTQIYCFTKWPDINNNHTYCLLFITYLKVKKLNNFKSVFIYSRLKHSPT